MGQLLVCQFNNGFADRMPRTSARLRRYEDYQPAKEWSDKPVKEVAVRGSIPPDVGFTVIDLP